MKEFREYVKLQDLSASTVEQYVSRLRRFGEYFQADPATLGEEQVREYLLSLREQKLSRTTCSIAKVSLLRYYHGCLAIEPRFRVFGDFKIRGKDPIPSVLTRGEVAELLGGVRQPRYRSCLTLIYGCGLRVREACNLEVPDIDSHAGRILVRNAKGKKSRLVPIATPVLDQLREYYKLHRNPRYLFPALPTGWQRELGGGAGGFKPTPTERRAAQHRAMARAAAPMHPRSVQEAWRLAVTDSTVRKPGIRVHTLRHSYATHLIEAGIDLAAVSGFLGHATLEQTLLYVHLTRTTEVRTQQILAGIAAELCPPSASPDAGDKPTPAPRA